MKKIILIAFLLLCSCSVVQGVSSIVRMSTVTKKANVVQSIQHDTIPIEIIGNWAVVEIDIAGENRKYVLDTGAPTVLGYSDVFNNRIVTKPKIYEYKYAENTLRYFANTSKIDTIAIGNNKYSDVGAMIADFTLFSDKMKCENVKGIIGVNVMKHGVWSFDYKSEQVIVASDINDFNLENSFVFDFREELKMDNPVINLKIGDKTLKTLIDTGNSGNSILLNNKALVGFDGKPVSQIHSLNRTLLEGVQVAKEIESDSSFLLSLDANDFDNGYTFMASSKSNLASSKAFDKIDMIMGYTFLKDFITTIDWSNKKVYFQPIQKHTIETNKTSKNMDIYFHIYDKKVYVFNYLDDYFPNGGINIGDTVKAINHIPIEEIVNKDNYCEVVRNERDLYPIQDTTIITVKNKMGETRDLKMFDVKLFD